MNAPVPGPGTAEPARHRRRWAGRTLVLRTVQVVVSFAIVAALFAFVLPRVTGTDGHEAHLAAVPVTARTWLRCWSCRAASLYAYTYVLCGSLPGLTHGRR